MVGYSGRQNPSAGGPIDRGVELSASLADRGAPLLPYLAACGGGLTCRGAGCGVMFAERTQGPNLWSGTRHTWSIIGNADAREERYSVLAMSSTSCVRLFNDDHRRWAATSWRSGQGLGTTALNVVQDCFRRIAFFCLSARHPLRPQICPGRVSLSMSWSVGRKP